MRWVIAAVIAAVLVAVVAAIGVNVLLLGRGVDRSDPVGRLSPVATMPATPPSRSGSGPATTTTDDPPAGSSGQADD